MNDRKGVASHLWMYRLVFSCGVGGIVMAAEVFGIDIPQVKEVIAGVVAVGTFAGSCYAYGRVRARRAYDRLLKKERTAHAAEAAGLNSQITALSAELDGFRNRFEDIEGTIRGSQDLWLRTPEPPAWRGEHQAALASSVPILTVVNLKGGVGKTTICANLAGYFVKRGKRVLLIDFDYQGSLTDTVLSHARIDTFPFTAQHLIEGADAPAIVRARAERLSSLDSRLWMYPAFYEFARSEIQMMFRWLVGQDQEIRYNLHNYLQSDAFRSDFDLVIIDAPPRLLTGVVNALAASTEVLVPTILDGQSHVATLNTLGMIRSFRQKLNPRLRTLGVVPTLVSTAQGYNQRELEVIGELERQVAEFHGAPLPILKSCGIARREELAKAGGNEILYLNGSRDRTTQDIRGMFDRLGDYVSNQLTWPIGPHVDVMPVPGTTRMQATS